MNENTPRGGRIEVVLIYMTNNAEL